LPDSSTGFVVSDIDFVLCNYKAKTIILLEVKTRNAVVSNSQNNLFTNIDRWLRKGIDQDWIYLGFHSIRFEKTFFNDGRCYFDGKEVTELELKSKLSL